MAQTSEDTDPLKDGPVIAEGVDEEPVEANRRLFDGPLLLVMSGMAMVYAMFHMAALNGVSISNLTGVSVPLLPQFPMETWNFRIVHIAGALVLGFLMYAAHSFSDDDGVAETPQFSRAALALLAPAAFALAMAISFAVDIAGGTMWNGMDAGIKFRETWLFGAPLLLATTGGIVLSWFDRRARGKLSVPDMVLSLCGIAVAAYLITIYGTLMRNSTGLSLPVPKQIS